MPSRHHLSSPPPPPPHDIHSQTHRLVPLLAGGIAAAAFFLVILTLCIRRISRKRAVLSPSCAAESKPPHQFSYASLRRATSNFDPSLRLGQGGFGSVYRGCLRVSGFRPDVPVAVKVMDSGSLQGEREFQNELFFAGKLDSDRIVPIIGFFSEQRCRRMLLVYDLMANGSLQDCLLHRKCSELKIWKIRFSIALDIAKGLEYLHHSCDPSVIHGDIKPSNILLDSNFNAKIGDFGLARLKPQDHVEIEVKKEGSLGNVADDIDETESVTTITNGFEDLPLEAPAVSPRTVAAMASPSEGSLGNFDGLSVDSGRETSDKKRRVKKGVSRNDWWWKQDSGRVESGVPVKDYVMEWIGSEIQKERPGSSELIGGPSSHARTEKKKKKKRRKRLDWWISMDEDGDSKGAKAGKRRPAREWWKEEYCEELQRKKKKKMKRQGGQSCDPAASSELPSRRRNSMDWWLDGISGELWKARRNSCDSAASGEIPKSGGISSTPSMRGTVCYAAPEYGMCGDHLSEKCDVYSYGVLLLVLIAGRRPLQVTGSPMSEFQRANLLSWARHLARAGKLLDLVDPSIEKESLNREEALMCIKLALLCLQRSPARRPSMKEVAGVLSGNLVPPELPAELSPSRAAARFAFKKVR